RVVQVRPVLPSLRRPNAGKPPSSVDPRRSTRHTGRAVPSAAQIQPDERPTLRLLPQSPLPPEHALPTPSPSPLRALSFTHLWRLTSATSPIFSRRYSFRQERIDPRSGLRSSVNRAPGA